MIPLDSWYYIITCICSLVNKGSELRSTKADILFVQILRSSLCNACMLFLEMILEEHSYSSHFMIIVCAGWCYTIVHSQIYVSN